MLAARVLVGIAIAIAVVPGVAGADARDAARHYRQGKAFYDAKDYARAIAEYHKAYAIDRKPAPGVGVEARLAVARYVEVFGAASAIYGHASVDTMLDIGGFGIETLGGLALGRAGNGLFVQVSYSRLFDPSFGFAGVFGGLSFAFRI